jgi:hypothetical protein
MGNVKEEAGCSKQNCSAGCSPASAAEQHNSIKYELLHKILGQTGISNKPVDFPVENARIVHEFFMYGQI